MRVWRVRNSRLNPEKIIFALASAWLLVTALNYLDAPEITRWGPARTGATGADVPQVLLDTPPPIDLGGDDPFRERLKVVKEDVGTGDKSGTTGGHGNVDEGERDGQGGRTDGQAAEDDDQHPDRRDDRDAHPAATVSVTFKGSMQVERRGRWYVFEEPETERYHVAKTGGRIGSSGLRIVGEEDRAPVVEYVPPRRVCVNLCIY